MPFLVYLVHASLLAQWIVDDAGITFAYARSLAAGYGLVAQPGAPPVEGYSNFTWLLAVVPFFWVNAFDPVWTPKILSALLVLLSLIQLRRTLGRLSAHPDLGVLFTGTLLSLNTGFVAWTTSGLENALYVFLTVTLLQRLTANGATAQASAGDLFGSGVLASAIAMTRPDGLLYFAFVPLLLAADVIRRGRAAAGEAIHRGVAYASSALLVFGGFLLFRRVYFDSWLPNTYYAKGGPTLGTLDPQHLVKKLGHFSDSLVPAGGLALLLAVAVLGFLWWRRARQDAAALPLLLHAAIGVAVFMLLPYDWMAEFRFASVAYPPLYALLFVAGESVVHRLSLPRSGRRAVGAFAAFAFAAWSLAGFVPRTEAFVRNPTVPMADITAKFADRFDGFAEVTSAEGESVLLPDVGGTLYYGSLRVYDLGKLTDREIARTLERDQRRFYDYVFERARPTFIHTHGVWAYRARLDEDARFRRDYVAIVEAEDPWVWERFQQRMNSGDYVRRDAVSVEEMERLRQEAASEAAATP